jgi:hypothetical protein
MAAPAVKRTDYIRYLPTRTKYYNTLSMRVADMLRVARPSVIVPTYLAAKDRPTPKVTVGD